MSSMRTDAHCPGCTCDRQTFNRDEAIKEIKRRLPGSAINWSGSDAYLQGVLRGLGRADAPSTPTVTPSEPHPRTKMIERNRNAWKK